MVKTL
jgi:hypothetical protein